MKRRNFIGALAALPFVAKPLAVLAQSLPAVDSGGHARAVISAAVAEGSMQKLWRKVQGDLRTSFEFQSSEWDQLLDLETVDLDKDSYPVVFCTSER